MVRTRMAPSPTGEYHIGHIRTILYNIAFAKKHAGKFIIRIEDTDRGRLVEGAIDAILDVIKNYGFSWDEGPRVGGNFGPYIQSERLPLYKKYALELIEKKAAYHCFCTPERLFQMREEQKARKLPSIKYDKHCLHLSGQDIKKNLAENMQYVIRLNVPENTIVEFTDMVFGKIQTNTNDIDDQILLKSDGFPTYHLGVVIDDHLMEISHVMRGNDWIPSTPKHILLYKAFEWKLPSYIHLPNLKELNSSKKLSKRYGPVSAREFLEEGYLPEALINFLMFLGWNPGTDREIYSLDEFVKDFDVNKIHKTDLVSFDRQKLTWMNQQYIQNLSEQDLKKYLENFYPELKGNDILYKLLPLVTTRMSTLKDFQILASHFFIEPEIKLNNEKEIIIARELIEHLKEVSLWQKENIFQVFKQILAKYTIKMPILYTLLTGKERGLPLPESLEILGRDKTINRLRKNIDEIK